MISIHALREEGDLYKIHHNGYYTSISIHALREEGDRNTAGRLADRPHFNPRPPRGGRPANQRRVKFDIRNFNPRPPRGGRRTERRRAKCRQKFQSTPSARRATGEISGGSDPAAEFQSTPSARRATVVLPLFCRCLTISIHALREEGDRFFSLHSLPCSYFNPRPPRGGRHGMIIATDSEVSISIHALREESDPST